MNLRGRNIRTHFVVNWGQDWQDEEKNVKETVCIHVKMNYSAVQQNLTQHYKSAAAKSRQSCPTLCDPIDSGPPGSHPWDSPGKHTGVGCHFLLQ